MERAFLKRTEAGRFLAEKLEKYANRNDVVVLGLPRGGVPVAYEVAKRLNALLDVFIVRKLGVPGFEAVTARETAELQRREQIYREERPPPALHDRIVILVDDGLATGATMRAAVKALRQ